MFFIQAAEFKGCYFLTLYSPSRWGSVIGQRTIWLQPPSPPFPSHSLQMYSAPGSLLPTVHKIRKCIIWIKAGHLNLPIASSQSQFLVFVLHQPRSILESPAQLMLFQQEVIGGPNIIIAGNCFFAFRILVQLSTLALCLLVQMYTLKINNCAVLHFCAIFTLPGSSQSTLWSLAS